MRRRQTWADYQIQKERLNNENGYELMKIRGMIERITERKIQRQTARVNVRQIRYTEISEEQTDTAKNG